MIDFADIPNDSAKNGLLTRDEVPKIMTKMEEGFTQDMLKFCLSVGAARMRTSFELPRKYQTLRNIRKQFLSAVRPIFLKYLPFVDPDSVNAQFNGHEISSLKQGHTPSGWNIHHQKPLNWGGRNFNREMEDKIGKVKLTPAQEKIVSYDSLPALKRLYFQLDNHLSEAQKNNRLENEFTNLFLNFLILLPIDVHEKLERDFIAIQHEQNISAKLEQTNSLEEKVALPLFYPVWSNFMLNGKHFSIANTKSYVKTCNKYQKRKIQQRLKKAFRERTR